MEHTKEHGISKHGMAHEYIILGGMFARRAPGYLCIKYPSSSLNFILT